VRRVDFQATDGWGCSRSIEEGGRAYWKYGVADWTFVKRGSAVAAELSDKMATAASNGNEQQVMDCSRASTGRRGKIRWDGQFPNAYKCKCKCGSAPSGAGAEASACRRSTMEGLDCQCKRSGGRVGYSVGFYSLVSRCVL